MLCDLCFNEQKSCSAIQRKHLEILGNSRRLAVMGVSTLPKWICDACDENLNESKLQIKEAIKLQEIKSEIHDFNDADNSVSWPHVEIEFIDIKAESMELSEDENTTVSAIDSENLEDEANLCKACFKICCPKDLNEKLICSECCPLEYVISDIKIKQETSVNDAKTFHMKLDKNFKNLGDSYICTICPEGKAKSYKSLGSVRKHIKVKHFGRRYECSECDAIYTSSTNLRKHYRTTHGKECRMEKFSSICVVEEDTESETEFDCVSDTHFIPEDEPLSKDYAVCNINKILHTISNIPADDEENHLYKCQFCTDDQTFSDSISMREHIELHVLRYVCVECNHRVSEAESMRDHYSAHHNTYGPEHLKVIIVKNPPRKQYHCGQNNADYKETAYAAISKKIIKFKRLLNEIKKDGGNYVCKICTDGYMKYTTSHAARHHIRSQHFGYQHPCSVCQKIFNNRQHLRRHLHLIHGMRKKISANINGDVNGNRQKSN